jgi:metal-dependent amidase/aminoacylase/carboxypeptidase family protein
VHNDPVLTALMERCAVERLGCTRVVAVEQPSLGAEDFAELLRDVPGTMLRLGVAGSQGCAPLHHCRFDPDESSLPVGIEVLTATLQAWMQERQTP